MFIGLDQFDLRFFFVYDLIVWGRLQRWLLLLFCIALDALTKLFSAGFRMLELVLALRELVLLVLLHDHGADLIVLQLLPSLVSPSRLRRRRHLDSFELNNLLSATLLLFNRRLLSHPLLRFTVSNQRLVNDDIGRELRPVRLMRLVTLSLFSVLYGTDLFKPGHSRLRLRAQAALITRRRSMLQGIRSQLLQLIAQVKWFVAHRRSLDFVFREDDSFFLESARVWTHG